MEQRFEAAVQATAQYLPSTQMAQVLRTCTVLTAQRMELIRKLDLLYPETLFTGRRTTGGVRVMGQFLLLTLMAQILRTYIASAHFPVIRTERGLMGLWFCRATGFME